MQQLITFGLKNIGTINSVLTTYGTIKRTFGIDASTVMNYINHRRNPYNQSYNPYQYNPYQQYYNKPQNNYNKYNNKYYGEYNNNNTYSNIFKNLFR
ncbi:MAG: hypothetical protein K0Q49_1405 [Haloplasmataceae bacterium]|jgi:hypothetical protein|nr:hypothetical protein [Haloplasmataceae bacterium]